MVIRLVVDWFWWWMVGLMMRVWVFSRIVTFMGRGRVI